MKPFEFVNAINSKKDIIRNSDNPELMEKLYNPFIINKTYSNFTDTIMYASEINQFSHIDSKLQFDYYLNSLRSAKRFSKWHKREENVDVEAIQEYYKVNYARAVEYSRVLTSEQIDQIKQRIIKGGNHVQYRPTSGGQT